MCVKKLRNSLILCNNIQIKSAMAFILHICVCVYLDVSLMWDVLQDDGLHGEDVGKLHLRDVERTHNMGPACQRDGSMLS